MSYRARTFIAAAACLLGAAVPARATNLAPYVSRTSTGSVTLAWTAAGGPYTTVFSTSPSFAPSSVNAAAGSASANYSPLNPDTTYYFRVKITAEGDSQYSPVSTATWVAAPGGIFSLSSYFTADSSFTAGASIGWNTNGNPDWTAYDLRYSTDSLFIPSAVSLKGYPPVVMGGLNANTTYYFQVRARGVSGTLTAYTPSISTATLALKLTGLSAAVHETSATLSWTAINGASQAERSEGYRLNLYTDPSLSSVFRTLTLPAVTVSTTLAELASNTTYYYRAGALNLPGMPNLVEPRSFTTLSPIPQNLTRIAVADGSAKLAWKALAAGAAQGYRLEASTTNFIAGGLVHSSVSYRLDLSTLTLTTIDPNTTYYFRVGSLNKAGAPNYSGSQSSVTLALPVAEYLTDTSAAPQEITVSFTPMSESPQAFACEGYRLEGSTLPSAWTGGGGGAISSVTYTYQDQLRSLTLPGLIPNTTYYLRLATLNWELTPNYTILSSTKTGFPGLLNAVALDVWNSTASAGISFIPGIAAEGHVAEASVSRFFNPVYKSSAAFGAPVSNLLISGLAPNTVYYFRAGALYNGTTVYSNTVPESRQTLPQPLTGLMIPAVFQSSITVAWTPRPGGPQSATAESYLLEASTGPAFSPVLSSSRTADINLGRLTIVSGLNPNTSYYFRAGTVNQEGSVNYAVTLPTSTMANQPGRPPMDLIFAVTPLTMTINWLPASNPADTLYLVRISSNSPFTAPVFSFSTTNNYTLFTGLEPNTTYYPEITAYNRLNRPSPVVAFPPMATGAYDPEPVGYSGLGISSVTLNWTDAVAPFNPAGTKYLAYVSSSSDFTGTVLSSITPGFAASFGGLVSNASYYLRVSALNLTGIPTDPAVFLGTALTLPATAYVLPARQTFTGLKIDGFTLNWADNGNSSHTVYNILVSTYNSEISALDNFSSWTSTRAEQGVNALSWTAKDLDIGATYWAQIQAQGQTGTTTDFVLTSTITTSRASSGSTPVTQDTRVELQASYGLISVLIPAGSLGGYTNITMQPESVFMPERSAVSVLQPTGIGLKINYSPPVLVRSAITITLPYRTSDLPGEMQPQAERARLILALFDETNAIWVPLPSVSDTANNRVIGQTWHLSTFQLMQASPEAGLSAVKIYPNPYRPNSVSDVMHFTNMTPNAKVRIYTFLGELVRELKADVNGMAHWDGFNSAGRKTASGIYIAFIQSKDKKSSKSFKVAIER